MTLPESVKCENLTVNCKSCNGPVFEGELKDGTVHVRVKPINYFECEHLYCSKCTKAWDQAVMYIAPEIYDIHPSVPKCVECSSICKFDKTNTDGKVNKKFLEAFVLLASHS